MSNFIKKRFTEVFHYVSDKPPALFREELGLLLSSSNKRQRVNIRGRFIAENAFEARRKWELGNSSPNMDTWMYLYGEIINAGEKTHIIISVTNPGAPFAFVPAVSVWYSRMRWPIRKNICRRWGLSCWPLLDFP